MKKIKIGGVEYATKLGLRFLENVTKGEEISLTEVFQKFESDTLLFLPKLIWHSINTANQSAGKEPISLDLVYDHLDAVGIQAEEIKTFIQDFAESIKVHIPQEENVGKPKKAASKT